MGVQTALCAVMAGQWRFVYEGIVMLRGRRWE